MYKIIEVISFDRPDKFNDWASKEKIRLLKWTANHDKAIGDKARHGIMNTDPPEKPMELDEARAITKTLIECYVKDIMKD